MREIAYQKIDAFTAAGSAGNPAACLCLERNQVLSPEEMLQVGREHKGFVCEVVFCTPLGEDEAADFKLVYYSSECEVDFCGHGTIACIYSLMKSDSSLAGRKEILIATKRGVLVVFNELERDDAVYIAAPEPEYIGTDLTAETVSRALGLSPEEISSQYPMDVINAGLRTLIVPIKSLDTEISMYPDQDKLKEFCCEIGVHIILAFSKEVSDQGNIIHTRVFAPIFGYLEDPATGSGNSAMGYYMLKNGMWNGKAVSIEQGPEGGIFNIVKIKTVSDQSGEKKVLFGGRGTTKIIGKYLMAD